MAKAIQLIQVELPEKSGREDSSVHISCVYRKIKAHRHCSISSAQTRFLRSKITYNNVCGSEATCIGH